jgi:CRISPR type III-B/RAMP module RAMP protein Cmr6
MNWNTLKNPNIGLLFNKSIYLENAIRKKLIVEKKEGNIERKLDTDSVGFDTFYKTIFDQKTAELSPLRKKNFFESSFQLFTTYPGLISGTGYQHDTGADGDFKIGFFFDHTSGQPIIPGSSIKGVLKSIFSSDEGLKQDLDAVHFILDECNKEHLKANITSENLSELVALVFGKEEKEGSVVFHDAVISPADSTAIYFLGSDFITPHAPDLLKNPTPLMFLKVLPNIAFDFAFDFSKYKLNEILSVDDLKIIFKQILLTIGAGAKTNVGYGQFSTNPSNQKPSQKNTVIASILDRMSEPDFEIQQLMQKGTEFEGEIIELKKENRLISILVNNVEVILKKKADKFKGSEPEIGKKVIVIFNENYSFSSPSFTATIL